AGVDVRELGDQVDAAGLVPGLVSLPQHDEGGAIHGEVWWIDRFGNCQLNVDPDELRAHGAEPGGPIEVRFGDQTRSVRWVHTYGDASPSELTPLAAPSALPPLAPAGGSAAAGGRLEPADPVTLVPPGATVTGATPRET